MRLAVLLAASLACVGIGFAKSAALSAHVKDLETLQKIIQYLRGEIVTAASPLPDAFWETGRRMRDPYRDFLQDISEDMRRPDGKTLPAILEENTAVHLADTRLTKEEIEEAYEKNTGLVIIETFKDKNPVYVPGVLCTNHGPFTWGADAAEAVHNAVVLEEVAKMAYRCEHLNPEAKPAPQYLQDKHFFRKHGANAYYGQGK